MNRELISVIDELGRQKGIEKSRVIGAIEAALQMAAKKRFGQAENIQVEIDSKTGEISVVSKKTIVDAVTNPKTEVSLQEARQRFKKNTLRGREIWSTASFSGWSAGTTWWIWVRPRQYCRFRSRFREKRIAMVIG
ncbi:MAG: hypothetical protein NTZ28_12590 [Nitrospirae bacterium]|nr:hypothetical protein [Nitrospirota bacterium]